VPPAGALARHGELAPHASQQKSCRVGVAPRGTIRVLVGDESAHANELLIVRGGDWSCEAKTGRARQRLVVRGGDFSEGLPIVGNLSKKLPTSREQDVLPVMVMTGVLSPPRLESWPSRCQWCQKTPPQE
jgi:hypothetical protein